MRTDETRESACYRGKWRQLPTIRWRAPPLRIQRPLAEFAPTAPPRKRFYAREKFVCLTYHAFSCERLHAPAAERHGGCRHLTTTRSAAAVTRCKLEMQQALQRRASERPLVGCYAELGCNECDLCHAETRWANSSGTRHHRRCDILCLCRHVRGAAWHARLLIAGSAALEHNMRTSLRLRQR
jgi:hypothetical protein